MYAEELVQKWIDEKRSYISENEILSYGLLGKLAVIILQEKYEGKYIPSNDRHFCGDYFFKNPLGHYEKVYGLYYMFPKEKKLEKMGHCHNYDNAIKEIIRLEYSDIYWHHEEQIPEYIDLIKAKIINNMYFKTRYWFIWEEEIWVV